MLEQIDLTPKHIAALVRMERDTGASRAELVGRALDHYIARQNEEAELLAAIAQGREDAAAGRVHTSKQVMAAAIAAIDEAGKR
ncbi:hypothetical protein [Neisseria bacilliformis]|uniref:hypothetical protein n=1 Tax=Neisseria bacilliformis TaxID=267212 RepID=UPI0006679BB1|nr:hypothetical protein [Neisseria bacilliformis]